MLSSTSKHSGRDTSTASPSNTQQTDRTQMQSMVQKLAGAKISPNRDDKSSDSTKTTTSSSFAPYAQASQSSLEVPGQGYYGESYPTDCSAPPPPTPRRATFASN